MREYTYRCLRCRDQGLVTVWSVRAMKAASGGSVPGRDYTFAQTICPCHAGEKFSNMDGGIKSTDTPKVLTFDDRKWRVPTGSTRDERIADLVEWMRGFRERQAVPYDEVELPDYRADW